MLIVEAVSNDQDQSPALCGGFSSCRESGAQRDDQAKKFVHVAWHRLRERAENNPA